MDISETVYIFTFPMLLVSLQIVMVRHLLMNARQLLTIMGVAKKAEWKTERQLRIRMISVVKKTKDLENLL